MLVYVKVFACLCADVYNCVHIEVGCEIYWELELAGICGLLEIVSWVMESELCAHDESARTLNHGVVSPAPPSN